MDFSWKEVGGCYEFSNANYIISNYSGISKIVEDDIQDLGPISGMYKSLNLVREIVK